MSKEIAVSQLKNGSVMVCSFDDMGDVELNMGGRLVKLGKKENIIPAIKIVRRYEDLTKDKKRLLWQDKCLQAFQNKSDVQVFKENWFLIPINDQGKITGKIIAYYELNLEQRLKIFFQDGEKAGYNERDLLELAQNVLEQNSGKMPWNRIPFHHEEKPGTCMTIDMLAAKIHHSKT